jgi:hypothetical protein
MLHVALSEYGGFQFRNSQKIFHTTLKTLENIILQLQKKFQKQKSNNEKLGILGIK